MSPTSHPFPSAVHVGRGAAEAALMPGVRTGQHIIYDPAIHHPVIDQQLKLAPESVRSAPADSSIDSTSELSAWIRARGACEIVAIGGGTTLDVVKLATVMADEPHLADRITRLAPRIGAVPLRLDGPRNRRVHAVATTIGTGSEVSASSSVLITLQDGSEARVLVSDLALAPRVAILDPQLTATLPLNLQIQGLFEVFARVIGADLGSTSALRLASPESWHLSNEAAQLLDSGFSNGGLDEDQLLMASMLSAQSHLGWALCGRPPAPSPLWVVADEFSSALGVTKLAVTTLLFPAWLGEVSSGKSVWGDASRMKMHGSLDARNMFSHEGAYDQLSAWGIVIDDEIIPDASIIPVCNRILGRWGGGNPLMRRFSIDDLVALLETATTMGRDAGRSRSAN